MNYLQFKLMLQDAEDKMIALGHDVDACEVTISAPNCRPVSVHLRYIAHVSARSAPQKSVE